MIDDKVKRTLRCMIIGSSLYNMLLFVIILLVTIFFYRDKNVHNEIILTQIFKNALTQMIGYIYSILSLYSMATSLSKSMSSNDEKFAKRHMIITSIMRLIAFSIIFIIIFNIKIFGIVGSMIFAAATLGIKVGAYLTPTIEKKIN